MTAERKRQALGKGLGALIPGGEEAGVQFRKREILTAVSILVAALAIIFYVIPNFIDMEEEFELASLSPAFTLSPWLTAICEMVPAAGE